PRPAITLLIAFAYGARLGFLYSMTGILLSSLAAFYCGRLLPLTTLERLAGRHLESITRILGRHGVLAVFILRVVPTVPHVVASALAGTLRVRAWHFIAGTFFGMLPGVLAATVFGDRASAILEDPEHAALWLAAGAIVLIGAAAWWLRRWAARQ
ncbi:MAG: VTT domain-containing protein, partial [Betaproteobacteria bacterium]|nr:VTT domain-containing protein [Betaproteobacteria bacterium]